MIIESLVQLACSVFSGLISGANFVSLPSDLINTLGTICAYGNWIVGADLLLLFAGNIVFWGGIKCSYGLIEYIWKLLPFT